MPKNAKPRTTTLNGVNVVILTPEQYAGLESARRRLGGAQAHVARMKLDLDRNRQLPGEAQRVLASVPADQIERLGGPVGPGTRPAPTHRGHSSRPALPRPPDTSMLT
ncbi:hypothetical protein ACWEQL_11600 [Kitasatospora sp. NPDC004240]